MTIKTRNEGSHLGFLWYLLDPLITFGILITVFSRSLGSEVDRYPLYLLLGIIHWQLMSFGIDRMVQKVIMSGSILKSMKIRPEILLMSEGVFVLTTFIVSSGIFIVFALILGATPHYIYLYPFLLLSQILLMMAISLLILTTYIYIRDILNVWTFLKQMWWFLTPIFYQRTSVAVDVHFLYRFNPMYHVINGSREILIYGNYPEYTPIIKLLIASSLFLMLSYFLFNKYSKRLNEIF